MSSTKLVLSYILSTQWQTETWPLPSYGPAFSGSGRLYLCTFLNIAIIWRQTVGNLLLKCKLILEQPEKRIQKEGDLKYYYYCNDNEDDNDDDVDVCLFSPVINDGFLCAHVFLNLYHLGIPWLLFLTFVWPYFQGNCLFATVCLLMRHSRSFYRYFTHSLFAYLTV